MQRRNFMQRIIAKIKPGFWLYLTVYALVLVIAATLFLIYTENSLNKYESSQAENVMEDYAETLKDHALSGNLPDGLSVPALYKQFDLEATFLADYCAQFSENAKMSIERKKDSYDSTSPFYDVYADQVKVAEIQLKAKHTKTIFAILSISDWELASFTPIVKAYDTDSIAITTLSTHQVSVNGVVLDKSFIKKQNVSITELESFKQYLSAPLTLTEYALPKSLMKGDISIQTEAGKAVLFTPDEQGNIYAGYLEYSTTVPSDYSETATNIAKAWDNFLTQDLTKWAVKKYLIKDHAFYVQADQYIGFISDHDGTKNVYKDFLIEDYTRYAEDCFSCHIKFDKRMTLRRDGTYVYTNIDSIHYFVNYDDTDDGIVNPTWKLVAKPDVVG